MNSKADKCFWSCCKKWEREPAMTWQGAPRWGGLSRLEPRNRPTSDGNGRLWNSWTQTSPSPFVGSRRVEHVLCTFSVFTSVFFSIVRHFYWPNCNILFWMVYNPVRQKSSVGRSLVVGTFCVVESFPTLAPFIAIGLIRDRNSYKWCVKQRVAKFWISSVVFGYTRGLLLQLLRYKRWKWCF